MLISRLKSYEQRAKKDKHFKKLSVLIGSLNNQVPDRHLDKNELKKIIEIFFDFLKLKINTKDSHSISMFNPTKSTEKESFRMKNYDTKVVVKKSPFSLLRIKEIFSNNNDLVEEMFNEFMTELDFQDVVIKFLAKKWINDHKNDIFADINGLSLGIIKSLFSNNLNYIGLSGRGLNRKNIYNLILMKQLMYTQKNATLDVIFLSRNEMIRLKSVNNKIVDFEPSEETLKRESRFSTKSEFFQEVIKQNFQPNKLVKRFFIIFEGFMTSHWTLYDVDLENKTIILFEGAADSLGYDLFSIIENHIVDKNYLSSFKLYQTGKSINDNLERIQYDFFSCHALAFSLIKQLQKTTHQALLLKQKPTKDKYSPNLYYIEWRLLPAEIVKYAQSKSFLDKYLKNPDVYVDELDPDKKNSDKEKFQRDMVLDNNKEKNAKITKKGIIFIHQMHELMRNNNIKSEDFQKIRSYYLNELINPNRTGRMTLDQLNLILNRN